MGALLLNFSCKTTKGEAFTKKDVQSAQKLIGLHFSERYIDTMYRYLLSNREGFDSMRIFSIDREISPAMSFNPLPQGFIKPEEYYPYRYLFIEQTFRPASDDSLAFYSVGQLSQLIKSRQVSCEELTRIYLARLKRYDSSLFCLINYTEDRAIKRARALDEELSQGHYRGLLHGIPYGIKDLAAVKGYPTTWGSNPYRNQTIEYDAAIVAKLDHAGAVLIAKLSSGALARGDVWFDGRTRNPWDTIQGASGSSAGSASATSAGLVAFSIGTETLGSIVSPSARCGVTGFRPSYGSVSRYGLMALSWSMDKAGPICRSAEDCAIVFDAIRGADERDPMSVDMAFNVDPYLSFSEFQIGYVTGSLTDRDTSESAMAYKRTINEFTDLGVSLDSINLPKDFPFEAFDIILRAEAGAFFDELVTSGGVDQMVEQDQSSRANSLRQSRFIPAVEYLQANRHRRRLILAMDEVFQKVDLILIPAFAENISMITNLTGHPAIALPIGIDKNGHPMSICLIGKLYDDGPMMRMAMEFQKATNYHRLNPAGFMK